MKPTLVAENLNIFMKEQTKEMTTGDVSVIVNIIEDLANPSVNNNPSENFTSVNCCSNSTTDNPNQPIGQYRRILTGVKVKEVTEVKIRVPKRTFSNVFGQ